MPRRFWLALGAAWFGAFVAIGCLAHRGAQLERRLRIAETRRPSLAGDIDALQVVADSLEAEIERLDRERWADVIPDLRSRAEELVEGVRQLDDGD